MKHICAIIISLLALGISQINAQNNFCTYVISGQALDANMNPMGFADVHVTYTNQFGTIQYLQVIKAGANGAFLDTICVASQQVIGTFGLIVQCNASSSTSTNIPIIPNQYAYSKNVICTGNNSGCYVSLNATLDTTNFTTTFTWNSNVNIHLFSFNGPNGPWMTTNILIPVTHTYPGPGTYTACLIGLDTISGCADTSCVSFTYPGAPPPCNVSIKSTLLSASPNVYQFNGTATGTPPFNYEWSYDGGATWFAGANPQIITVPNGMNACVRITDSNNCQSQKCKYLTGSNPNCHYVYGNITDSASNPRAGIWVEVYDLSPAPAPAVLVHSMQTDFLGNYGDTVCLNTAATQGNLRIEAHCDTTMGPVWQTRVFTPNSSHQVDFNNCQAGSGSCSINLYLNSISGLSVAYSAFFSTFSGVKGFEFSTDGGISWSPLQSSARFSHTFGASGTYTICARASDNNNCTVQDCLSITVTSNTNNQSVCGNVTAGNSQMNPGDATVLLIQYDSIAGTLTAFDTAIADSSGYYYFPNLPQGAWLVKAFLNAQSSVYANYLPTYYGNSLFWNQAVYAYTPNTPIGNTCITDISLVQGNNPGGPGFIGGLVSQGANISGGSGQENTGPGDPIANALVLLLDASDNAIGYTLTNAQGEFSFNALAYGTYKVYTEVLGIPTDPYLITIDAQTPSYNGVTVVVNSNSVTTGLDYINAALQNVTVYPNPVSQIFTIDFGKNQSLDYQITLIDVFGKRVKVQSANGVQKMNIEVGDLPQGVYILEIIKGQTLLGSQRILKN